MYRHIFDEQIREGAKIGNFEVGTALGRERRSAAAQSLPPIDPHGADPQGSRGNYVVIDALRDMQHLFAR